MSRVRTHFCTLVARVYGDGTSPRKYGLNGTMPALTSSSVGSSAISDADGTTGPAFAKRRVGSSAISDADGTTVWPFVSKWDRNRRRISADDMPEGPPLIGC